MFIWGQPQPPPSISLRSVKDIIGLRYENQSSADISAMLHDLQLTENHRNFIQQQTKGQRKNPIWLVLQYFTG